MDSRSDLENRALRYLARREYSRLELQQKLSTRSHSHATEVLVEVLDKLEQAGYLSAQRVVEQIIRNRRSRFGSQRILHELKTKGFDDHTIDMALIGLHATETEAAIAVWQKKFGVPPGSSEERVKQIRFMMSRGFSMKMINQVFRQVSEGGR